MKMAEVMAINPSKVKAGAAVALIAAVLVFWWLPTGDDAGVEYVTETINRGDIQRLVVTSGAVKAVGTVEVGSQISGQISELHVDFNSEVKTGDLLAVIDPRTYEGRLKQAQAQLEIAKANVVQQQASLKRAQADFGEASRLLERQKSLGKSGLISASEIDRLQTALESATAQVTIVEAQVVNARASVTQAQASEFQARIDLERCTIRSPVDGVVINRNIELGQTVAASMSAPILFTIAQDLGEMQVEARVDEADIGRIQAEQEAVFTVEAFPERKYRGIVKQVRKAATEVQNVVTYTVIVSADNRDKSLLPGMTATVEVITGNQQNVLRIPNTALRFKPTGVSSAEVDPRQLMMENRLQTMKLELSLTAEQETALRKIMDEQMANMPAFNGNGGGFPGGGGGFPGGGPGGPRGDGPSRNPMNNDALREILSEAQFEKFREQMREGMGGRRRANAERPTPGTLWLRDAKGELVQRNVLVGLAGDEYTELLDAADLEGAEIIVRARRTENN